MLASLQPRLKRGWIALTVIALALVAALAFWITRAPVVPVVESVTQLSNDGQVKLGSMEADASRVYFNEGPEGSYRIAQVSVNRLPDGKPETLVSLKDFRVVDDPETGPSLYPAPDVSVLVTRDIGTQEVYAITVKWP